MERPSVLADASAFAAVAALNAARADWPPLGDLPSSRSAGPSKRLIWRPRGSCGREHAAVGEMVRARSCRSRLRP
jgi:hypothetical protein